MRYSKYHFTTEENNELFKFTSVGTKGEIKKLVVYTQMVEKNVFNLAFGDYYEETQLIDDEVISDNNDGQKVLATVAATLYYFTDKHPDDWVYVVGSSPARTRMYRIGIANNLNDILVDFEVYGLINDIWYKFDKDKPYESFLIKRKSL